MIAFLHALCMEPTLVMPGFTRTSLGQQERIPCRWARFVHLTLPWDTLGSISYVHLEMREMQIQHSEITHRRQEWGQGQSRGQKIRVLQFAPTTPNSWDWLLCPCPLSLESEGKDKGKEV